jgi:hypothetical protein
MPLFGGSRSSGGSRGDNGGTWVDCDCLEQVPGVGLCPCTRKWQIPPGKPVPEQPICCQCSSGNHSG